MRRAWLVAAAAIGGVAGAANAADVQIFGIHTPNQLNPSQGNWAVYARISNPAAQTAPNEAVMGISSIGIDVLNANGHTVATAVNKLPSGTTNQTYQLDVGGSPVPVGYGYWLFKNATVNASGAVNVVGAQFAEYDVPNNPTLDAFVIRGTGLPPANPATQVGGGSQAVGGNFTSATNWQYPLLIAQGTYNAGPDSNAGLNVQFSTGTGTNVLLDTNPDPNIDEWTGPGGLEKNVTKAVIDAGAFWNVRPANPQATGATARARSGDANLDGQVGLEDLVILATYYGQKSTWFQGDFTYDGETGLEDLVALATYYGSPLPAPGELPVAANSAQFEADYAAVFSAAAVPEPAGISVAMLAGAAMTLRRRARR